MALAIPGMAPLCGHAGQRFDAGAPDANSRRIKRVPPADAGPA